MKIGDYVRNKYGIAKVVDISNNNGIDIIEFDRDIAFLVNKETKKEHSRTRFLPLTNNVDINKLKISSNIIDLIEVGDILSYKNKSVARILEIEDKYYLLKDFSGEQYYEKDEWLFDDLESIVTKEMFANISYKVGE